jgi:hypothetical protein
VLKESFEHDLFFPCVAEYKIKLIYKIVDMELIPDAFLY